MEVKGRKQSRQLYENPEVVSVTPGVLYVSYVSRKVYAAIAAASRQQHTRRYDFNPLTAAARFVCVRLIYKASQRAETEGRTERYTSIYVYVCVVHADIGKHSGNNKPAGLEQLCANIK